MQNDSPAFLINFLWKTLKVNVWAGIVGKYVIGSFFIDGNLNRYDYLALLQNNVPTLANLYPDPANSQVPANVWYSTSKAGGATYVE